MMFWKDICIYGVKKDMYEVSRVGTIRNKHTLKIIKPFVDKDGYLKVSLVSDDPNLCGKKKLFVHRIVAITFIPNPENKEQVNHKHGDKAHPTVDELEWVTINENRKHQFDTGLQIPQKGEEHHQCKTTEKLVRTICQILSDNGIDTPPNKICELAGIEKNLYYKGLIKHLKRRSSWSHVTKDYEY